MEIYKKIKKDIINFLVVVILVFSALNLGRNIFGFATDNSDIDSWNRSGLIIYTDNLTKVQYVGNSNGITVRLDSSGNPVICDEIGEKLMKDTCEMCEKPFIRTEETGDICDECNEEIQNQKRSDWVRSGE